MWHKNTNDARVLECQCAPLRCEAGWECTSMGGLPWPCGPCAVWVAIMIEPVVKVLPQCYGRVLAGALLAPRPLQGACPRLLIHTGPDSELDRPPVGLSMQRPVTWAF